MVNSRILGAWKKKNKSSVVGLTPSVCVSLLEISHVCMKNKSRLYKNVLPQCKNVLSQCKNVLYMVQKCVITLQKCVITVQKCVITVQKIIESLNHACTYTNFSIYLISMVWMCHFLSAWWVHSFLVTIVGLQLSMMQRWLPSSWITTDPTRLLLRYGNSHFPFMLAKQQNWIKSISEKEHRKENFNMSKKITEVKLYSRIRQRWLGYDLNFSI